MKKLFPTFIAFLGATTASFASLAWESLEVSQTVDVFAQKAVAQFPFTNTGDSELTITNVKTSCGCTATTLKKKTYSPGESGVIEAELNIGDRLGVQKKTVRVYTDQSESPTLLTMTTTIPAVLEVSPRFLFWKSRDGIAPKTVDLKVGVENAVNITEVKPSSDKFDVRLETLEAGRHYRLIVTPNVSDKQRALFTVYTDYPVETPKSYKVHAHIR
ncbi:MAG: DUF1573 domain-containing protein [Opitutales bacterium]